jgi:hypothetical protein
MLTFRSKPFGKRLLVRRMDCRIKSGNDDIENRSSRMSERALAFVDQWVNEHIRAEDADGDIETRATALAGQCLADAGKKGIPAAEINDAFDDLADYMVGAIEEAEERDEHAHQFETDKEAAELVDPKAIEDAEEDALEDEEDDDEKQ